LIVTHALELHRGLHTGGRVSIDRVLWLVSLIDHFQLSVLFYDERPVLVTDHLDLVQIVTVLAPIGCRLASGWDLFETLDGQLVV
jgi:hypothetical protein